MTKEEEYKALKKLRRDWGDVKPYERIEPDRKKVPKKIKHKKRYEESLEEEYEY